MRVLSGPNHDKSGSSPSSSDDKVKDGIGENPLNNSQNGNRKEGNVPISGGGGGGGGEGRNCGQSWIVSVAAAVIVSVVSVCGMWYIQRMGEDTHAKQQLLSEALVEARLENDEEKEYIPIPTLESKILNYVHASDPSRTVMVCGPRGSGKSTAVYHALMKEKGVVHLNLTTGTLDEFESQILETVDFKRYDLKKVNVIHKALLDIRRRGKKPPTFIVEVNNQCTSKCIFDLLVRMKEWTSDVHLANFVVVLSLSQAALTIPVGLEELRVSALSIQDPPNNVVEKRLDMYLKTLKDYKSTEKERKLIFENHISMLGTRFLYVMGLIGTCKEQKCETVKDVQAVSKIYTDRVVKSCEKAVDTFLEKNKKGLHDKKLLQDLVAEKVDLDQLCKAVGKEDETFLDQLAKLHPRPIFVEPMTKLVLAGNYAAKKKFQEQLNKS